MTGLGIAVVGASFRTAPLDLRARLLVEEERAGAAALAFARGQEAVVLSTCNRTEVYLAGRDAEGLAALAREELLGRLPLPERRLRGILYARAGEPAVRHLCRVAAGLDSAIPGETEILGQVRRAYEAAAAAGAAGLLLERLFARAVRAGRRVRNETALLARPASFASAAARVAARSRGGLTGRRVLVVGAGRMGELAAAEVRVLGADVVVASRTVDRAAAVAARVGARAVPFARLRDELASADVVVSATRSAGFAIAAAEVAAAGRPLLLIDLAVPRDVDPAVAALSGCRVLDLDDLARLEGAETRPDAVRAEAIVAEEAARVGEWLRAREAAPAIASLRREGEAIRARELARAERALAGLSEEQRRAVEALTARLLDKLLHVPTVQLRESAGRLEEAAA